jgi:NTE family protein
MPTVKTALVLAGGGSLGAVQVGMLQALVEAEVAFDLVVGASVGAINGAYFAARPNAQGVAELGDFWRGLRKADVFPISVLDTLTAILQRRGYLLRASALQRLVRRSLPVELIEDTELPLHIVTTNLLSGAEELLSSGSAEQALLASAAIPLVFPSVQIGEKFLVDGGVASNTPIASAVAPLCPLDASVFDFSQTDQLMQRAYQSTQTWIEEGGLIRTGVPGSLQAHTHHVG